jgi:hypothetical protein
MDYGPLRFDVRIDGNAQIRLMPVATAGILIHVISGNKFRPGLTLKTGTVCFQSKDHPETKGGMNITYANSISVDYKKNNKDNSFLFNPYSTTGHELIHAYQYREWNGVNNYYCKNSNKFIYWDFPVYMAPYLMGEIEKTFFNKRYYSNPYELEAESLSRRHAVNWDRRKLSSMPKESDHDH